MKVTIKELRKILEESIVESSLAHRKKSRLVEARHPWGEFTPGMWLTLDDGTVVKFDGVEKMTSPTTGKTLDLAHTSSPFGHGVSQKAEILLKGARKATPEEVADTVKRGKEHTEWLADVIDTSKEGT